MTMEHKAFAFDWLGFERELADVREHAEQLDSILRAYPAHRELLAPLRAMLQTAQAAGRGLYVTF